MPAVGHFASDGMENPKTSEIYIDDFPTPVFALRCTGTMPLRFGAECVFNCYDRN